jgi:hypothetical protein
VRASQHRIFAWSTSTAALLQSAPRVPSPGVKLSAVHEYDWLTFQMASSLWGLYQRNPSNRFLQSASMPLLCNDSAQ